MAFGIVQQAVSALDMSLRSIVADDTVNKRAAIAESVGQFKDWLVGKGIGRGAAEKAADEVVRKYQPPKKETDTMESPIEKQERAISYGKTLGAAIDDYARDNNVSKSVAADRVLLHASTSEYARMDKELHNLQQEAVTDRALRKAAKSAAEQQFAGIVNNFRRQGMSQTMAHRAAINTKDGGELWDAICDGQDEIDDANEDMDKLGGHGGRFPAKTPLEMQTALNAGDDRRDEEHTDSAAKPDVILARVAAKYTKDGLSRSAAMEKASYSPEVAAAIRREQVSKGLR
jgi:hypothetical protein